MVSMEKQIEQLRSKSVEQISASLQESQPQLKDPFEKFTQPTESVDNTNVKLPVDVTPMKTHDFFIYPGNETIKRFDYETK